MGKLRRQKGINPGYYSQIEEAASEFSLLARELLKRADIKIKK